MHCQFSRPDCPIALAAALGLFNLLFIALFIPRMVSNKKAMLPPRAHTAPSKLHINSSVQIAIAIFSLLLYFRSTFRTFASSRSTTTNSFSLSFADTNLRFFLRSYRLQPISLFFIIPSSSLSPLSPIQSASLFLVYSSRRFTRCMQFRAVLIYIHFLCRVLT